MPVLHLFPNGDVERGTGKPGYRWVPAYSQVTATGETQPSTRKEWCAVAKRDGYKCKFHPNREAARKALESEQS